MKKLQLIALALLAGVTPAVGQSKINTAGRQLIDLHSMQRLDLAQDHDFAAQASRGGVPMVDVLVETKSAEVLDSLAAEGYAVEYISPSFSLVSMPIDEVETLALSPRVSTLSFGEMQRPSMNEARGQAQVNTTHTGLRIEYNGQSRYPFKGDGVIVGMMDTGLDPTHVNFYDANQEASRLRYYVRFSGTTPQEYRGDACVNAQPDRTDETHGTHVAGIMGGAFNGDGTFPAGDGRLNLYGVAPNAELALCAGPLYNANILLAIRKLINYANSQGKPLAVNLSLGSNIGPHDGSTADVRAIDELGKECIICIAAGNEGGDLIHVGKPAGKDLKEAKVLFANESANRYIDIWGSNDKPYTVSIALIDAVTGNIVSKVSSKDNTTVNVAQSGSEGAAFAAAFSGNINMTSKLDTNNKRYNVQLSCNDVKRKSGQTYLLALVLEAAADQRIDVYGNGEATFKSTMWEGYLAPDYDGTISDMCCGKNTIVVGSFNTRSNWIDINGKSRTPGGSYGIGSVSNFSSWGNLVDGRSLPHVCAPGAFIFSSLNNAYASANIKNENESWTFVGKCDFNGKTHYWGALMGTSMATPFVTGAMGLWLQADPTLTVEKARNIIQKTATAPESGLTTQWGAGKLNVYNGIKEVIAQMNSGVDGVTTDRSDIIVANVDGAVEVSAPGAVNVALYNLSGAQVAAASGNNTVSISAAPGIYVLKAQAGASAKTEKIVVR